MGQAGRDPLFWAAFAVANDDASDAGEFCCVVMRRPAGTRSAAIRPTVVPCLNKTETPASPARCAIGWLTPCPAPTMR
jgi:hypothetical protein